MTASKQNIQNMGVVKACPSLVPRLLPSFLWHTVQKTGEPGRFDHVRDDVLCVVYIIMCGFGNRIIAHARRLGVFNHAESRLVDCHSA